MGENGIRFTFYQDAVIERTVFYKRIVQIIFHQQFAHRFFRKRQVPIKSAWEMLLRLIKRSHGLADLFPVGEITANIRNGKRKDRALYIDFRVDLPEQLQEPLGKKGEHIIGAVIHPEPVIKLPGVRKDHARFIYAGVNHTGEVLLLGNLPCAVRHDTVYGILSHELVSLVVCRYILAVHKQDRCFLKFQPVEVIFLELP